MADTPANKPELPARRIADVDREMAERQLRDAASEGRIDFAELEQRIEAALVAKTQSDLDAVTADLPAVAPVERAQPLVITTKSGTVKRKGYWRVPPTIDIECGSGRVMLNFTEADCPHREVNISVTTRSGAVVFVVPTGWAVDMEQASAKSGSVVNRMRGRPVPGTPILRISGTATSGTIKARRPHRSLANWLRGRPR